jgi:hypothetical protein
MLSTIYFPVIALFLFLFYISFFFGSFFFFPLGGGWVIVLDLVCQIRDVVLRNVYLDLENPGGSGFWDGGYMNKGREMGRSVYEQPGNKMDRSCHSKEGFK